MTINDITKEAIVHLRDELSEKRSYLTMRIQPGLRELFLNEVTEVAE
jgi:hypothetical protein